MDVTGKLLGVFRREAPREDPPIVFPWKIRDGWGLKDNSGVRGGVARHEAAGGLWAYRQDFPGTMLYSSVIDIQL